MLPFVEVEGPAVFADLEAGALIDIAGLGMAACFCPLLVPRALIGAEILTEVDAVFGEAGGAAFACF